MGQGVCYCDGLDSSNYIHFQITFREYVGMVSNLVHPLSRTYLQTMIQLSKMTLPQFTQVQSWFEGLEGELNIFSTSEHHWMWNKK